MLVEYEYTANCTYPENPPRSRGVCDSGPDDETGVALLSPADGHVVWRTPVIASFPDVPYARRPQQILRAADDRVATVVATNLRTGEKRWERRESGLMTAAGDVILVRGNGFPMLSVSTGKEVARFGAVSGCATDKHKLIACTTPDDGMVIDKDLDLPGETTWHTGHHVLLEPKSHGTEAIEVYAVN